VEEPAAGDESMEGETLTEQLVQAIEESGLTRYRIAKGAGIDYYSLARFLDEGRDIQLSTVQKLAEYFGMRFTKPKTPKKG
jgi:predicted transcriptional regulator